MLKNVLFSSFYNRCICSCSVATFEIVFNTVYEQVNKTESIKIVFHWN